MKDERIAKGIYWDRSWNPFTGCSPVGTGCDNCWARRTAEGRLRGRCGYSADEPFRPTFHPDRLPQMNSKQKPRVIACCFMSDPFHEGHDPVAICDMLTKILELRDNHTFIALTKRPEMMRVLLDYYTGLILDCPIPNLVGGVSIWDQPSADRMIPILLETNLATRIVSLEPMLGAVDLSRWLSVFKHNSLGWLHIKPIPAYGNSPILINGVILGGESGPGARPMHPDWVRSVRDQCQEAGVPFFFKQWGEWLPESEGAIWEPVWPEESPNLFNWLDCSDEPKYNTFSVRVGKKAAGRMLDGRTWDELPGVLR